MSKYMTEDEVRNKMQQTFHQIASNCPAYHGDLIAQSVSAYERKRKHKMPESLKAVLVNSMAQMSNILVSRGFSRQAIQSAAEDITKVDNPVSMLFNLMSILIPNYAYAEVAGVQPMPSNPSPIYYPQLSAAESRNGVNAGDKLLGSTNWNTNNYYSTNKVKRALTLGATISFTAPEASILPNTVRVNLFFAGVGSTVAFDDGKGAITPVPGYVTSGTVNYDTGEVEITPAATPATGSTGTITYRYADDSKPAQVKFEWATRQVTAEKYRLRSTYSLDNFYAAQQVLGGYDIDEVMSTSLAGYINKEVSENVFEEMLASADASYSWVKTPPTAVSWAMHRLSVLQTLVAASNGLRENVYRSGGNVIVADTELISTIETLGSDLWVPTVYPSEPIGPYVAGNLAGKFKVLKNQGLPTGKSFMSFKKDESDASFLVGVFIGLYSTNPLALDDLSVVQGLGSQFGAVKAFDNSVVELNITA